MANSQTIHDEDILLDDAYDALSDHFLDRQGFIAEYERINDSSLKKRFLRLASAYKFLVKSGNFIVPQHQPGASFNFFDMTFKFIAIISIIEAIYSHDEWIDFYQWLDKSRKEIEYPIDQTTLEHYYSQYKSEYGSIRNTVKFFKALDAKEEEYLKSKVTAQSAEATSLERQGGTKG